MKGGLVKTVIACISVTSIVALTLACPLSVSAEKVNEYPEVAGSKKTTTQAPYNELTRKQRRSSHMYLLRVTAPEDRSATGGQFVPASTWQPLPGTSVSTASSGVMTVSSRATFWAGAIAYPQVASNYRLDVDARLHEGGSGYGLVVRAGVTDGKTNCGIEIIYPHAKYANVISNALIEL